MLDVAAKDTNKLLGTHDQQLVQALPADRADPALGDRVGVGRPHSLLFSCCRPLWTDNLLAKRRPAAYGGTSGRRISPGPRARRVRKLR
jgi:hypothetical protein